LTLFVDSSTLNDTEKGFPPDVQHVGVPHVVMAEKGQSRFSVDPRHRYKPKTT